jgi:hypothetical protein
LGARDVDVFGDSNLIIHPIRGDSQWMGCSIITGIDA